MMNHKERVLTAINHAEPDRVPLDLMSTGTGLTDPTYKNLLSYLGLPDCVKPYKRYSNVNYYNERILEYYDIDFRSVWIDSPKKSNKIKVINNGEYVINEWGITFKYSKNIYDYSAYDTPLKNATIDEIESYEWPDPNDEGRYIYLEERAKRIYEKGEHAIIAKDPFSGWLFEYGCWLRGYQQFCEDLMLNEELVRILLEKIYNVIFRIMERYSKILGKYVDIFVIVGDYAHKDGLIISPNIFKKYFKEPLRKEIEMIKSNAPNAKVMQHCCGAVYDLIPDFIDIGIDILNPIQPGVFNMDFIKLKKEFGYKLVFHGGIDVQKTLPFGTIEDIKNEVMDRFRVLAINGGYIMAPANHIQHDVSPEKIDTLYKFARGFGKYPIK